MKEPVKILIIDDDAGFRKLLEIRLKAVLPGLSVKVVDSLNQARKFLTEHKDDYFDLIVLDQHLSDGRGIELLKEGWFEEFAVLSVSSDNDPCMPGENIKAGATYFLRKDQINEALFGDLVRGIIDRNRLRLELLKAKADEARAETVKTLVGTLRHEINNPLGAVMGAAYVIKTTATSKDQTQAAELVQASAKRIEVVLEQLCKSIELELVKKAKQPVFHIPGDGKWE